MDRLYIVFKAFHLLQRREVPVHNHIPEFYFKRHTFVLGSVSYTECWRHNKNNNNLKSSVSEKQNSGQKDTGERDRERQRET